MSKRKRHPKATQDQWTERSVREAARRDVEEGVYGPPRSIALRTIYDQEYDAILAKKPQKGNRIDSESKSDKLGCLASILLLIASFPIGREFMLFILFLLAVFCVGPLVFSTFGPISVLLREGIPSSVSYIGWAIIIGILGFTAFWIFKAFTVNSQNEITDKSMQINKREADTSTILFDYQQSGFKFRVFGDRIEVVNTDAPSYIIKSHEVESVYVENTTKKLVVATVDNEEFKYNLPQNQSKKARTAIEGIISEREDE